ncbi:alpha/beta hydrolase [Legionella waltersii]|uniref:alpha/beta hydrolase n=1 Tax=Legionella waltersii TaxID=66969 RepID=UPI0009FB5102|nr:alpha/beta hydrolase [Legionella waltersii]
MIKQIVLLLLFVISLVVISIYIFQRHLIYFPDPHKPKLIQFHAEDMSLVQLHTKDKLELTAWYKAANKGKPTVLYLHGNAGHIGYRMPVVRPFLERGYGVLLLEYRGYGANPGKPSEKGLYLDAEAGFEFLSQHGVASHQLVIYGESLGTGVATYLASKYPVCALVLQTPFTSLVSLTQYHYPFLFIKPWDRFESLERIKQINAPLLVLHGKRDSIVPYEEGLAIFNAAHEPKKMLTFEDKNHNDLWTSVDFAPEVIRFIDGYCVE